MQIENPRDLVDGLSVIGNFFNGLMPTPPFGPIVDGDFYKKGDNAFVSDEPWKLLTEGKFNDVSLVIGANKDEGLLFSFPFFKAATGFAELKANWTEIMAGMIFGR